MKPERCRTIDGRKRGFTLLEALLAAAVLGVTGYVLAVAFNNGQTALLNWEQSSEVHEFRNWALATLDFSEMDRETLETGDESLRSPEGMRLEWKARAYPTLVLDVFVIEIEGVVMGPEGSSEPFRESRLIRNPEWYESDREREQLVEDKERRFEAMQKERARR
ncbi:MAG: prepilin-type N-terminal cleavage/methylation domain-containing protein [Puniceicoccaceae bacterium]